MTNRFINPRPQFMDTAGNPLPNAEMNFYENGTLIRKDTFSDVNEDNKNENPVPLNADGSMPNVFYAGTARVILTFDPGTGPQQRFDVDGVGQFGSGSAFDDFNTVTEYENGAIVVASDGQIYRSLQNNNIGNDPVASPSFWEQVEFIRTFNVNVTYGIDDIAKASNGLIFRSLQANNLNNDPLTSPLFWGTPVAFVDVNIIGILSVDDTTNSISTTTGSIHTDGGLGVVKDVFIGGDAEITQTKGGFYQVRATLSGNSFTPDESVGSFRVWSDDASGVGPSIAGIMDVVYEEASGTDYAIVFKSRNGSGLVERMRFSGAGNIVTVPGILSVDSTMDSTSTTTGSIHTDGGLGVAKTIVAGTGIKLGGTAAANLLDDYEEGTFAAVLSPGTGTITLISSFDTLSYIKIGHLVHVQGLIVVDSISSPTGLLNLTGLPFTSANLVDGADFSGFFIHSSSLASSVNLVQGRVSVATDFVQISTFDGTDINFLTPANIVKASTEFQFNFSYQAA